MVRLRRAGMRPPLFFVLPKKSRRRSGGKENALGPKPALWAGLDKGGSYRGRYGADLRACTGCPWALGNREGAFPHVGDWMLLSGWSTKGLSYWPRAFRFAVRCRDVAGAAAEKTLVHAATTPKESRQYQIRGFSIRVLPMSGALGRGLSAYSSTVSHGSRFAGNLTRPCQVEPPERLSFGP